MVIKQQEIKKMKYSKDRLTISDEMKSYKNWQVRAIKRIPVIDKLVIKFICSGLLTNYEKSNVLIKWEKCKYKLNKPNLCIIDFWIILDEYTRFNRMLNTCLLHVNKSVKNIPVILN